MDARVLIRKDVDDMQVLVTGGAGFIGANLCHALTTAGHSVQVLDNLSTGDRHNLDGIDAGMTVGTILDVDLVTTMAAEADTIVHLAARSSVPRSLDDPEATHQVNATGTLNVLEAGRRVGGRHVIVASSSSVYGANPALPKAETAATRPMSPYAASKLAAESYALAYGHSFRQPTLAFRFFNVFGPLQSADHAYAAVIPALVDAALRGNRLPIHGDGSQSRDFTHVDTVCRTIVDAVERRVSSPEPVNLAFGSRIDLNSVITRIGRLLDRPLVVEHLPPRPGDVRHSQADGTSLRALFPTIEPLDFGVGLEQTIDWMRTHLRETGAVSPADDSSPVQVPEGSRR